MSTTQFTYIKGWQEGRTRAGERLKIAAKKGNIVAVDKTFATTNDQNLEMHAKSQMVVCSQSGSKDLKCTELVVQEHEVAVWVPRYVVSELELMVGEEQHNEWVLGMVHRSYIEEHSHVRMYDVLFANGMRKCIPSGYTEQIPRHEKDATQHTKIDEPMCNISSDDDSEDEDGCRDGDDSWQIAHGDDLHEQAQEWEAWEQSNEMAKMGAAGVLGPTSTSYGKGARSPRGALPAGRAVERKRPQLYAHTAKILSHGVRHNRNHQQKNQSFFTG